MQKLEVFGANKLKGQIKISGSKNASLPILAATLLSKKKLLLKNLPRVKDIETMASLLQSLGSKIKFNKNNLVIDNIKQTKSFASYSLVKTMRAGILVLGPLLAKFGKAKVSLPGGCAIGTRPVDIHLNALSSLGVKYKIVQGHVHAIAPKGLIGNKIRFPKISVGATENLIIAASFAKGTTDLQAQMMVLLCKANKQSIIKEDIFENRFMHVAELNRMGAKISTNGNKAKVSGNINFEAAELMATDLRASVSLILAALTTKGKSVINRIYHLDRGYENIEKKLKKVGAKIRRVN